MTDDRTTQVPLSDELAQLRQRVAELEASQAEYQRIISNLPPAGRLARLNECFLGFGPDPLGNINRIVTACGEALQADVALYNRLEAGLLCAWGQWHTPGDFRAVDQPEGHICFDVINRGADDMVLIRDLQHSSYAQTDPNVSRYGLQTYLGRAVKFDGVAVGSLCAIYLRDFVPDADDKHLLGVMAAAIGVEEKRRAAEQQLQSRETQLARYAQQMAALYKTSLEVNSQPDVPSLLQSIVLRAAELLSAPMAGLYLLEPDGENLVLTVNYNISSFAPGIRLRLGEGVAGRVAQNGQALMIENYHTWEGRAAIFTRPEFVRVLGVPLKVGGRVIGVIDIDDPQAGVFSEDDVRLVSLFADQAAIAIENAHLLQHSMATAERRAVLYRAMQTIGASVDREQICQAIHQAVAQVMPAEALLIALVMEVPHRAEPDVEEVYLFDAGQRWPGERYPLHAGGFTRYIITQNQSMLIENFNDPTIVQQTGATDWGDVTDRPLAAAAVPLRLGEKVTGMISVQSNAPHRYTAIDQELLEMLAAYSATAFENARLFAVAQQHVLDLERRVTERTRDLTVANDQLAAANTRLTELDRLKDQFISRISHELRTPLASIKIYLELLTQASPEKREKYMRTLSQETDRLHRLIEDLLNYTELKLVLAETDLRLIDLNQFAAILVQEYTPVAAQHGLELQLSTQPGLSLVYGDSSLIRQMVVNLINNALSYSTSGTITLSTQAAQLAGESRITVSVRDQGPGITPKDLAHIFERFYRGEAARDYKIPGTGLGLAIARDIAAALGGEITVESVQGEGATFTVWLRPASA